MPVSYRRGGMRHGARIPAPDDAIARRRAVQRQPSCAASIAVGAPASG